MTDNRARLERNDRSLLTASHYREPWSSDELEFLITFFTEAKGDPDAEAEVAAALGRTIEACRQRFYVTLHGLRSVASKSATSGYIGHCDDPDDCWWSPDYNSNK